MILTFQRFFSLSIFYVDFNLIANQLSLKNIDIDIDITYYIVQINHIPNSPIHLQKMQLPQTGNGNSNTAWTHQHLCFFFHYISPISRFCARGHIVYPTPHPRTIEFCKKLYQLILTKINRILLPVRLNELERQGAPRSGPPRPCFCSSAAAPPAGRRDSRSRAVLTSLQQSTSHWWKHGFEQFAIAYTNDTFYQLNPVKSLFKAGMEMGMANQRGG